MSASLSRPLPGLLRALAGAAAVLCLCATAAVAQKAPVVSRDRGEPRAEPRTRVLKTWEDTIKVDGKELERRLELSYDYDRGLAILRAYGANGVLMSQDEYERGPRPSAEEMEEAVGLLLADRQIGAIMRSRNAVVEGGFILEEKAGQACGPRTRCLQIQLLSPDRIGLIRWSVVDLTKRQIVYPVYAPSANEVRK